MESPTTADIDDWIPDLTSLTEFEPLTSDPLLSSSLGFDFETLGEWRIPTPDPDTLEELARILDADMITESSSEQPSSSAPIELDNPTEVVSPTPNTETTPSPNAKTPARKRKQTFHYKKDHHLAPIITKTPLRTRPLVEPVVHRKGNSFSLIDPVAAKLPSPVKLYYAPDAESCRVLNNPNHYQFAYHGVEIEGAYNAAHRGAEAFSLGPCLGNYEADWLLEVRGAQHQEADYPIVITPPMAIPLYTPIVAYAYYTDMEIFQIRIERQRGGSTRKPATKSAAYTTLSTFPWSISVHQ